MDVKQLLTDDTVATGDPGTRKNQKSDMISSWGAAPSAIEKVTKGEIETDPDIFKTDKLKQLFL